MQCLHVNIRQVTFILLSLIINNFTIIQMADNEMDHPNKERRKDPPSNNEDIFSPKLPTPDLILYCPTDSNCSDLPVPCIECDLTFNCIYGNSVSTICKPKPMIDCKGARQFTKELICRYCYQTEIWEHVCDLKANCNSVASPRPYYATNCTVKDDILCLGHRTFSKNVLCNWTGGYRWSTALILSITLGGFGADRFYLGHWQEGIGKLFSFGGLGVWTIIDVILISLHYLGPADGSLYI